MISVDTIEAVSQALNAVDAARARLEILVAGEDDQPGNPIRSERVPVLRKMQVTLDEMSREIDRLWS